MLSPSSNTFPTFTVGTKVGLSMSTSFCFFFCAAAPKVRSQRPKNKHIFRFTVQKYEKVKSKRPAVMIIFYTFVL